MVREENPLIKHIIISIVSLTALLVLVFYSFSFVQNILLYPERYFSNSYSASEIQFAIVYISLIVVATLISYIIYLLLSSRTRASLIALAGNKWLAISREQFRRIYEEAPIPYITLDKDGNIREPNKAALRFFGVVKEEIEGQNLFNFRSEEDQEKAEKLSEYYKRNVPINREEIRMVSKSEAVKWVELSVFDMRNPASSVRTGLATILDITEQKKLSEAKTQFLSLASHQLRTPAATTKWYMDMLLSGGVGDLSEKQKDYVERIYRVNEEMISLVDTLLNVSRIEIGTLPVNITKVNIGEICESVILELSSQIEKKGLEIARHYNNLLNSVETDPKLIRIVIQNLISNSVKYTPDGGKVSITFSNSPDSIIVSDNGLGIPKAEQHRVFEKLFRAGNVANIKMSQGTGLGLYLVKSIMKTLGGDINFVSEEGKGSSFTINF